MVLCVFGSMRLCHGALESGYKLLSEVGRNLNTPWLGPRWVVAFTMMMSYGKLAIFSQQERRQPVWLVCGVGQIIPGPTCSWHWQLLVYGMLLPATDPARALTPVTVYVRGIDSCSLQPPPRQHDFSISVAGVCVHTRWMYIDWDKMCKELHTDCRDLKKMTMHCRITFCCKQMVSLCHSACRACVLLLYVQEQNIVGNQ